MLREALKLLPETYGMSRAVASTYAATCFAVTGEVTLAQERRMREAVAVGRDFAREIGQISSYAVPVIALGRMHVLQGRRREAAACFEQAHELLGTPVERWSGHSAISDIARAELLWEQNDLDEAERLVRQGLELRDGPTTAGAEDLLAGSLLLARLLQARGEDRKSTLNSSH